MIGGLAANAATGWSIGQLLPQVQGVVLGWRPLRDTVAESTVADMAAEKSSASGHLQRPRRDKQPPLDIDSTGRNAQIAVIDRRFGELVKSTRTGRCLGLTRKSYGAQSERLGVRRLAPPPNVVAAIEIDIGRYFLHTRLPIPSATRRAFGAARTHERF
jgi:hypothetical protein